MLKPCRNTRLGDVKDAEDARGVALVQHAHRAHDGVRVQLPQTPQHQAAVGVAGDVVRRQRVSDLYGNIVTRFESDCNVMQQFSSN